MVATHRDNIDSCRVALDGVTRCSLEVGRNWRISLINLVDETFVDRLLLFERNVRIINKQESWDDEAERGEAETRAFREIVTVQWKYFPQSGKSSFDYLSLSLSLSVSMHMHIVAITSLQYFHSGKMFSFSCTWEIIERFDLELLRLIFSSTKIFQFESDFSFLFLFFLIFKPLKLQTAR